MVVRDERIRSSDVFLEDGGSMHVLENDASSVGSEIIDLDSTSPDSHHNPDSTGSTDSDNLWDSWTPDTEADSTEDIEEDSSNVPISETKHGSVSDAKIVKQKISLHRIDTGSIVGI